MLCILEGNNRLGLPPTTLEIRLLAHCWLRTLEMEMNPAHYILWASGILCLLLYFVVLLFNVTIVLLSFALQTSSLVKTKSIVSIK